MPPWRFWNWSKPLLRLPQGRNGGMSVIATWAEQPPSLLQMLTPLFHEQREAELSVHNERFIAPITRTIRATVQYQGTRFAGYQRQNGVRSVQEALEGAFARVLGQPVTIHGAGRTDAGVHALGQVISARLTSHLTDAILQRALNSVLPDDVSITYLETTHDRFHARFSALWRDYLYVIYNQSAMSPIWRFSSTYVREPLDVSAMHTAVQALVGRHDFATFGAAMEDRRTGLRGSTVRTMHLAHCWAEPPFICCRFVADAFLRSMVRSIVGTLLQVGRGKRSIEHVADILASAQRSASGPSAPPHGLFLVQVGYQVY